jgi:hypothetical protein
LQLLRVAITAFGFALLFAFTMDHLPSFLHC